MGDLLVELPANDQGKNRALARCEGGDACTQRADQVVALAPLCIARQRVLNGLQQCRLGDRLGQEVLRAAPDGLHARRYIAVSRQEYDWQNAVEPCKTLLQLEPIEARHAHVEQDAARINARRALQQLVPRFVQRNAVAGSLQQPSNGCTKRPIVVYHVDNRRRRGHVVAGTFTRGSVNRNAAPPPARFSAQILPP